MITVGDLLAVLKLRDEMTPELEKAQKSLGRLNNAAGMTTYQLTLLGRGIRQAGSALTTAITLPLVGAAAASIKFAKDFEEATVKLVTLANVTEGELEGVRQKLLEMAPSVGIGPVKLAEAFYAVSSTIEDTAVAMDVLKIAAKATAIGMGDTTVVAKALTSVVLSYGKDSMTAAKAADILAMTIKKGGAEAKELAPTLANVVPFAAKLGVSFEEVGANLATLTALGIPTSEAVTMLTSIFAGLTRETQKGQAALKGMGKDGKELITTYAQLRARIKEVGLAETLSELSVRYADNQKGLFNLFGRLEAFKNILGTTGAQMENYRKNLADMKASTGSFEEMYDKASKTFAHMWKQVVVELQVVAVELGNELLPIVKDFLKALKDDLIPILKDVIAWFKGLPDPMKTVILAFGLLAAALGPFLFGAGQIVMAVGNIGRALGMLTLGAITKDVGALALSLGGLKLALIGVATAAVGWGAWELGKWIGDRWNRAIDETADSIRKANQDEFVKKWARDTLGVVMSAEEAHKAFTKAAEATSEFKIKTGEAAAAAAAAAKTTEDLTSKVFWQGGAAKEAALTVKTLAERVKELTAEQINNIRIGQANQMTPKQIADEYGLAADVVGMYIRQQNAAIRTNKEAESSMRAFNDAMEEINSVGMTYEDTIAGMNGETVEAIKYYLAAGVSQKALVDAYAVTDAQVRILNKSVEEEARIRKEATEANNKYKDAVKEFESIGIDYTETMSQLTDETIESTKAGIAASLSQGVITTALGITDAQYKAVKQSVEAETEAQNKATAAAERFAEAEAELVAIGTSWKDTIKGINPELIETIKHQIRMGATTQALSEYYGLTHTQIKAIILSMQGYRKEIDELAGALSELSNLTSGGFSGFVGWMSDLFSAFSRVSKSIDTVKQGWEQLAFGDKTKGALQLAAGILEIGNAFMKATEKGNTFQKTISGAMLGFQVGSQFGGVGAVVGAGIGAVAGLIRGLIGPSAGAIAGKEADAEIQKLQAELLKTYGTLEEIAKAGGAAGAALVAAWGSKNVQGLAHFKSLLEDFNKALEDEEKRLEDIKKIEEEIVDVQKELDEQWEKLESDGLPKWQDMADAAEEYGISLDSLGTRYDQLAANATAQAMINAFDTLTKGGTEVGTVLAGMADEISLLVQRSIQFGTTIPENMRPWIQNLIDTGQLLDENGEKITDISEIKFGAAQVSEYMMIKASIDTLNETLDKLLYLLETLLPQAAEDAASGVSSALAGIEVPEIEIPITYDVPDVPSFAGGGIMPHTGLAMLHAGERVTPPGQSSESSSGDINVTLVMPDGDVLLRQMVKTGRKRGLF